jgi:hypothetical protein
LFDDRLRWGLRVGDNWFRRGLCNRLCWWLREILVLPELVRQPAAVIVFSCHFLLFLMLLQS